MSNEFVVDLISNASMDIYKNNTLSEFTNRLQKLILDGERLVAVQEIIYPLAHKGNRRTISWATSYDRIPGHKKYLFEYTETDKITNIVDSFNKNMLNAYLEENKDLKDNEIDPPLMKVIKIQEDGKEKEKISFKLGRIPNSTRPIYPLCNDQSFMRLLGFDIYSLNVKIKEARKNGTYELIAPYQPDTGPKGHLVFICTDIIHEHLVGDTHARVLRVIPLNKNIGDTLHHMTFTTPYYYPVRMNQIEEISIRIVDEGGDNIKFKSGRVFLSLHFKRKDIV